MTTKLCYVVLMSLKIIRLHYSIINISSVFKSKLWNSINRHMGFNVLNITSVCSWVLTAAVFPLHRFTKKNRKTRKRRNTRRAQIQIVRVKRKRSKKNLKRCSILFKRILEQCLFYESCNRVLVFCGMFFDANFELKQI